MKITLKAFSIILFVIMLMSCITCCIAEKAIETVDDLISRAEKAAFEEDYETAYRYFLQAAEQGSVVAQRELGKLFYSGDGVEQSYEKAAEHFKKAADGGGCRSTKPLRHLVFIWGWSGTILRKGC